jgi:hypothetical protein
MSDATTAIDRTQLVRKVQDFAALVGGVGQSGAEPKAGYGPAVEI